MGRAGKMAEYGRTALYSKTRREIRRGPNNTGGVIRNHDSWRDKGA